MLEAELNEIPMFHFLREYQGPLDDLNFYDLLVRDFFRILNDKGDCYDVEYSNGNRLEISKSLTKEEETTLFIYLAKIGDKLFTLDEDSMIVIKLRKAMNLSYNRFEGSLVNGIFHIEKTLNNKTDYQVAPFKPITDDGIDTKVIINKTASNGPSEVESKKLIPMKATETNNFSLEGKDAVVYLKGLGLFDHSLGQVLEILKENGIFISIKK